MHKRLLKTQIGLLLLFIFISHSPSIAHSPTDFYYQLAFQHAPHIYQDIGFYPRADLLTRFDYDGDLIGNNNWENLELFPTLAYVYYDVIETETHYFITYAFFHPRDYDRQCFLGSCHENDLEGIILTILKDGSLFGQARVLETQAHNKIYTFVANNEIRENQATINGRFVLSDEHRVSVYIEPQGHGVYEWHHSHEVAVNLNQTMIRNPQSFLNPQQGIQYIVGSHAEDPSQTQLTESPYHYQLIPLYSELWERRHLLGEGQMYDQPFLYQGNRFQFNIPIPKTFDGVTHALDRANPPWAWDDRRENFIQIGEWFLDPAFTIATHVILPEAISLDYIYNPYLEP